MIYIMYKSIFAGLCLFALAACGSGVDQSGGGGSVPGGGSTNDQEVYIGDTGDMNNLVYDAANDQLVINNLPFDGVDGVYLNNGQGTVGGAGPINGFGVYESQSVGQTGAFQYYAVFRESGNVRAGAAGTGDYAEFGHGGAMIARNSEPNSLPIATGELVYTGLYAGIRVIDENSPGGSADVQLVSGDAELLVDLLDFDITGSIVGFINNRTYYDVDGNPLGTLPTIVMNEGSTISADGRFTGGTVTTFDSSLAELQNGTFEGMFAGPNGEEVVGAIILTGPAVEGSSINSKETGVFILAN